MRPHPVAPSRKGGFTAGGVILTAAIWAVPAAGQVSPQTGTLNVQIQIVNACDISGGTSGNLANALLDFGQHSLLQTAIDADTDTSAGPSLQVLCNPGVSYTLTFGQGQNWTGTTRRMAAAGNYVTYQLFSDALRQNELTPTTNLTGTGTGTAEDVTIYGRVPAGQNAPPAGTYTDVVTITMTF